MPYTNLTNDELVTLYKEVDAKRAQSDAAQQTQKVKLNSAYGALSNPYFRYFDDRLAESITLSGQLSVRYMERHLNRYLNELLGTDKVDYVIAIDTDSIYLNLESLVKKLGKSGVDVVVPLLNKIAGERLAKYIAQGYDELATLMNAAEQKMFMKREVICFPPSTRIETRHGRIPIKKIKVGDEVLTHEGRYRPVKEIMKNWHSGDMITLTFGRKPGRGDQTTVMTPNHPVWVERNGERIWIAAEDVIIGDIVFTLGKSCPKTGDVIPYWCDRSNRWNAQADDPAVRAKTDIWRRENWPNYGDKTYERGGEYSSGAIHRDKDIIPFCEEMVSQGWRMILIDPKAVPDAIGIKDGKIVAFEVEKTQGRLFDFKVKKYENSPMHNYVDHIEWVRKIPERKQNRSVWYEDAGNGFVKVKVTSVTRKPLVFGRGKNGGYVYNLEVDDDHTYVAGHLVVHNCDRAVWIAKKRYVMNVWVDESVVYTDPELKIVGMEAVRSSTPEICRTKIKEAMKVILNKDNASLIEFLKKWKDEFFKLPFEDIAFPSGINGVDDYSDAANIYKKGTPIHVRASLVFNNALRELRLEGQYQPIKSGDKIRYCYLQMPNPFNENVIATNAGFPPAMQVQRYIDYHTQYEKTFMNPIQNILDIIGWESENRATLF